MSLDTLWYTRCAVPTPLGIAGRLGRLHEEFEPDGLEVRTVTESENVADRESHYDHSLDYSFRLGGSIPPIWTRARGRATRVIGISWVDEFQGIVVRPESGIRNARDLAGRRLGLPKHDSPFVDHGRASALRGFLTALELAGITREGAELVDLADRRNSIAEQGSAAVSGSKFTGPARKGGSKELLALIRGEVDALYLKGPRGLQLVHQLGLHVAVDLGSHPDPLVRANNCTPRPLTVDERLSTERPDLVERLVRLVVETGGWASHHPAETVQLIGQETGTAESWVRHGYGVGVADSLQLDLTEQSVKGLMQVKNFLFENGFLQADFEVAAWIDPAPLDAVMQAAPLRRVAT